MKAKAMAWLLTWFIVAQSTLISYHTEAFVKTEVACTVDSNDWAVFWSCKYKFSSFTDQQDLELIEEEDTEEEEMEKMQELF